MKRHLLIAALLLGALAPAAAPAQEPPGQARCAQVPLSRVLGKFEAALQFLAHPDDVFIGQHQRDAFLDLIVNRLHSGRWRMAG